MLKQIIVNNLWGEYDLSWSLSNQVSVLAGGNGTGKSTVLRSVAILLHSGNVPSQYQSSYENIEVLFDNNTTIINSLNGCDPKTLPSKTVSNFISLSINPDRANDDIFCSQLDDILRFRNKKIVRNVFPLQFELHNGVIINYENLSAGEKEIINIYNIAREVSHNDIIILDEPEQSLHFDWQENLIEDILKLSGGKTQIIVSTHSPAIIMHGWMANVIQMESLVK